MSRRYAVEVEYETKYSCGLNVNQVLNKILNIRQSQMPTYRLYVEGDCVVESQDYNKFVNEVREYLTFDSDYFSSNSDTDDEDE
jgi:hypothetical protein